MTNIEYLALKNDLTELTKHFNNQYINIYRLPAKPGCSYCLKIVASVPSYVRTRTSQNSPVRVSKVSFYVDIYNNYPAQKPKVYYGGLSDGATPPYHVNVFSDSDSTQCTDIWNQDSSLVEIIEKTVRCIVFDPIITRFDSMANPRAESFMRRFEGEGKFPTMDPSLLFTRSAPRRNPVRTPHRTPTRRI